MTFVESLVSGGANLAVRAVLQGVLDEASDLQVVSDFAVATAKNENGMYSGNIQSS